MAGNTYAGKNLRIRVDGKTIFHATDCSFTTSRTMESIASKDTNGEQVVTGSYTWGVSSSYLVANIIEGSETQIATKQLLDLYQSGAQITAQFTTNVIGDVVITGLAFIESLNMSAPTNGVATGDASFKGNGNFYTTLYGNPDPIDPEPVDPPYLTVAETAYIFSGVPFTFQITATNSPTSFGATGLPDGLSINTTTGLISGTPTTGTMSMVVSATNAGGTGTRTVTNVVLDGLPPTAPSSLVASAITETEFFLSFTQSTFNGGLPGNNIDLVEIYKNSTYFNYMSGSSSGTLIQLQSTGTTNLWKLRAKDVTGVFSDFSEEISVTQL